MLQKKKSVLSAAMLASLAACATPGQSDRADTYTAAQVNQRQVAIVVNILAVLPAKVQVSNEQNRQTAQIVGGILGAGLGAGLGVGVAHSGGVGLLGGLGGAGAGVAAGSLVAGLTLVEGVSLTYEQGPQTFNSVQVGRACEYAPGKALMVQTSPTVTRIQPNHQCPAPAKKR